MANQTASSQIFALVDTRTPIGIPSPLSTALCRLLPPANLRPQWHPFLSDGSLDLERSAATLTGLAGGNRWPAGVSRSTRTVRF